MQTIFFQNSSVQEQLSSDERMEELETKTENLRIETGNLGPENLQVETENTIQSEIKFTASDFSFLDKAGTVEEPKISGNFVGSVLSKISGTFFLLCMHRFCIYFKESIVVSLSDQKLDFCVP